MATSRPLPPINKPLPPRLLGFAAGLAALLAPIGTGAADLHATWLLPSDGFWSDAAKWDSAPLFPNNDALTFDVTVGAVGAPYTVTLATDIAIGNLDITSADATLTHTAGILQINGALSLQAGTYRLAGGAIQGGTITGAGGTFFIGNNSGNRLDGVTFNGGLNLTQPGGSRVRLQNGAAFTGSASLGTPDGSISQLASERVNKVEDVVSMGDEITVMVTDIDGQGKIRLSRQAVLEGWTAEEARAKDGPRKPSGGGNRGGSDRGGRR